MDNFVEAGAHKAQTMVQNHRIHNQAYGAVT